MARISANEKLRSVAKRTAGARTALGAQIRQPTTAEAVSPATVGRPQRRMPVADLADGPSLTVHVPLTFRNRGSRKVIVTPAGVIEQPRPAARTPSLDDPLVKALARAHLWRQHIEAGVFASVADLAAAEGIDKSYVSKVLRLTLLAPDIIDAILDRTEVPGPIGVYEQCRKRSTASHADRNRLNLERLLLPFPVEWVAQRRWLAA